MQLVLGVVDRSMLLVGDRKTAGHIDDVSAVPFPGRAWVYFEALNKFG